PGGGLAAPPGAPACRGGPVPPAFCAGRSGPSSPSTSASAAVARKSWRCLSGVPASGHVHDSPCLSIAWLGEIAHASTLAAHSARVQSLAFAGCWPFDAGNRQRTGGLSQYGQDPDTEPVSQAGRQKPGDRACHGPGLSAPLIDGLIPLLAHCVAAPSPPRFEAPREGEGL